MFTYRNLALSVVLGAILVRAFVYWAMLPCKAFDIPRQKGRMVIVTGANSGTGYGTALKLASRGATVVMACRSLERCAEVGGYTQVYIAKYP